MVKNVELQIASALEFEHQSHALENALQARHSLISRLVDVDEVTAGKQLLDFVLLYIRSVPDLLDDFSTTAQQIGLNSSVDALVDLATSFLNFSPEKLGIRSGVTALMVKAYLANRLLEEINDACQHRIGKSMIPVDMTITNTIIHSIIGEPFANDLDALVDTAVEGLLSQHQEVTDSFMHQITHNNLVHIWQRLPSLSSQAGFKISLPN